MKVNNLLKKLRVYNSVTVKIENTGQTGANELIRNGSFDKIDPSFEKIYEQSVDETWFLREALTDEEE